MSNYVINNPAQQADTFGLDQKRFIVYDEGGRDVAHLIVYPTFVVLFGELRLETKIENDPKDEFKTF